jgi:hypothetical protein
MDEVQKRSNSEYYTPSSEPFRIQVSPSDHRNFILPFFRTTTTATTAATADTII